MTCRKKASGNQHFLLFPQYLYPAKQMFSGVILESACLSIRLCVLPTVCPTIHVSVCVQNTSYCQSTGWGIKSHLVTALVSSLYMTKIIILVQSNPVITTYFVPTQFLSVTESVVVMEQEIFRNVGEK